MTDSSEQDQQQERQQKRQDSPAENGKLSWWQMIGSSLAAAFGVQSSRNKERDFTQGSVKRFVITGIVLTLLFLLVMLGIVQLVLSF